MGHHIDEQGRFQSDKYPDLPPDKIVLSFKDAAARVALSVYATFSADQDLAADIDFRLDALDDEVSGRDNEG